ncbi:sodium:proton antiporter [Virgibacillus profundi]|uniref:Sodium:proton antiporter n=1 Tax=Virgibacillus profundi TaxID=2024555 RepID=A0A2A2IGH1_9BACI|nr:Na+/H+ antiporter NhaC family protein [Virgibacillus profundi]PAV30859.1 sodium:proton antiporter [Virgibacillus profundi]PXY55042.1 Na+/H+ antiporter NhaC family protein [Virgibacillus profundi]
MDFLSIVPPLVAVVLAIFTKRVLFSLFISIWVGGLIAAGGNPFEAVGLTFTWMKDVMIDPWNARFLVMTALLGTGAAFMFKTGGSDGLIKVLQKKLTTGKRVQMLSYFLGIIIFFNDYVNSVIVGNATKDITAKHKVSREKLSYIIDSTAAPMATIGPVSDWIGFQVSLIAAAFVSIGIVGLEPYFMFLQSIPWNFYAILCLFAVPMIILGKDFGPMAKAEHRAKTTGKLIPDGSTPLSSVDQDLGEPHKKEGSIWNFILPLVTLITVSIWGLWYTGGGATGISIMDALAATDVSIALTWGAFAMTLVGIILALIQGMGLKKCEDALLGGIRTMLPALIIIVLAWSIGTVTSVLGTAEYVVAATEGWMTAALLPFLIFVIGMFISFATGTSWGTMSILTPIAIPLAYTMGGEDLIPIVIGAIFAGAIFGDHVSPISDTTVMASIFAESDHIAHVNTQIPYAMVPAGIAGVLYLTSSFLGSSIVLLIIGIVAQFFLLRYLGNRNEKKYMKAEKRIGA